MHEKDKMSLKIGSRSPEDGTRRRDLQMRGRLIPLPRSWNRGFGGWNMT
jgi:hypothetical protein